MNPEALARAVARFSFRGLLRTVEISARRSAWSDGYEIAASLEVPHAETGEPIRVHCVEHIDTYVAKRLDEPLVIEIVDRLVRRLLMHEGDEGICVDGNPVHEPHPGVTKPRFLSANALANAT